ncbi:MAG TPA: DNA polymerase III subunit delta [Candidatus Binatia bacterium]|nr:DNA polymerase III subunit delta [Candidatus Binatia bacterium]
MNRDLTKLLSDIKGGRGPELLLLFGDDLPVEQTAKAIVDLLVPEDRRGFNLERFDGRVASWEQIEAALMTPPFLPGKKVLWVQNAPYFFSKEQKGELSEKILELWREGRRDDAVKSVVELLVLEGWTQEQWERLDGAAAKSFASLFDSDAADRQEIADALLAYCKNRDLDLTRHRGGEGHRLMGLLDQSLPEWSFLLLTAEQVDRRTRLYKRFEQAGAALYLGLERDQKGKLSRENLLAFIHEQLARSGKSLEPRAREMLVERASGDLRGLKQELDKLVLFAGDRASIRAGDVEAVVTDRGEGWIFDLTRAIAERDAAAALGQLARLLSQGDHPLRLLGTIASEVRRLLAARQLLDTDLAKRWRRGMSYAQFQQAVLRQGEPLLTRNPYADYMCFQRAERFSLDELRAWMESLFEADLRLKSSAGQPRLVMEKLVLDMCLGSRRKRIRDGSRIGP